DEERARRVLHTMLTKYCPLFGLVTYVHAQQPSYYRIGEKECTGIDLYSITQDEQGHIWLSSNKGLLRYDGYTFHQYRSDAMKSNSLFGVKKDREGTIYCNNLVGQFFRIEGDSLQLFVEVPDSLLAEFIEFNFDNRNQLVFRAHHYYQINEQGDIQLLLEDEESGVKNIPRTDQDELILVDAADNKFYYYKNGAFRIVEQSGFDVLPDKTRPFFNLKINQNRLLLHGQRIPVICEMQDGQWKEPLALEYFKAQQDGWNTYLSSDGHIWLVSERNGSRVFDRYGKADYQGVTLLPSYRISCFLEDEEGNLWLPTLGKGIIVIPNRSFIDYRNHPLLKEDDIKSIDVDQQGRVYLGGISGKVYQIEKNQVSILLQDAEKVSAQNYLQAEDKRMVGSQKSSLSTESSYKFRRLWARAKDIVTVGADQYFLANYAGVKFYDNQTNLTSPLAQYLKTFENGYQILPEEYFIITGRTHALAWEATRRYIWVGTDRGLKVVQPDTTILVLHQGQAIHATSLVYEEEKIWVSTSDKGILVYQQDSVVLQFNKENGLLSNDVRKIILKDNVLYLISKAGLQWYDLLSHTFSNITQSDGLLSEFILDFAIVDQTAWLVYHTGVQKIPLNYSKKKELELALQLNQVTINGSTVPLDKPAQFNYDQNEVSFELMAKGYQHRGKLIYQYQLKGWKDDWAENSYLNNKIEYKSLPPGSYQFMARAVGQNQSVSPQLTYAFAIKPYLLPERRFYRKSISK
ncbi:MAG: triple tyrosine motif-containing protein, partial [Bacteroidota bacterium]